MTAQPVLTYLLWQDTDKKKAPAEKIAEACVRYEQNYGKPATVVLINPLWVGVAATGVEVRVESHVRPDTCWVGDA